MRDAPHPERDPANEPLDALAAWAVAIVMILTVMLILVLALRRLEP